MTSPLLEVRGCTNDPCEGAPWLDGDAKEREDLRTMLRVPAWITGWTVVPFAHVGNSEEGALKTLAPTFSTVSPVSLLENFKANLTGWSKHSSNCYLDCFDSRGFHLDPISASYPLDYACFLVLSGTSPHQKSHTGTAPFLSASRVPSALTLVTCTTCVLLPW